MKKTKKSSINKLEKELVLARMETLSDNIKISIGSNEYKKGDVLKSVAKGDKLGKQIIDMQMSYLRDLAKGKIYTNASQ